MDDFWSGYFTSLLVTIFVVMLVTCISTADEVRNNTWDQCQTSYEQSHIPFEGRDNFMRGCFEGK